MSNETIAHPRIASREEWREKRLELLAKEKAHTREYDRINAERRRMPMVNVEKDYIFDTPAGKKSLKDLFEGQAQLVVYHFMFDPEWEKGCGGCTGLVDALGDLSDLGERNTTFVLVSRAPLEKLEKYRQERGWDWPWVSSFGSDFNYDFNASLGEGANQHEYSYPMSGKPEGKTGEAPGMSVFFRVGDDVYHANSMFSRGVESLTDSYAILDITPYGRQEDFEDSPEGWPQRPTYG